jgi:DNA-binding NtrC family response regulator
MPGPVLIVEDDLMQQEMLSTLLRRKLGYESSQASNGHEALKILENDSGAVKLVIMDLNMPVMSGMEALEIIRQRYPLLPVVMLTGSRETDDAVKAIKLGATDFITKPFEKERLLLTVRNALKMGTLTTEVSRLVNEKQGLTKFSDLIGYDSGLSFVVNRGRKAAISDIPVLITGETGTGKEIFSRAIHGEGSRAGKPFIAVNCGAIPSQLVESILFGHEKGSFTGATEKTVGKFREASGGTIFLDEIGELPMDAQVKLLRVLQQKEVEPVGASKPVSVNVRIISATNRNLEKLVQERKFREDLFFRLNVLQIELPPLRERRQDIPLLARHFIERFCVHEGRPLCDITPGGLNKLSVKDWVGNIRELENAINRAMVLNEGSALDFENLSDGGINPQPARKHIGHTTLSLTDANGELRTMEELETLAIQSALSHFSHNVTHAAKALGMSKSTLYRKMAEKGLV